MALDLRLKDFKDRVGLGTRANRYELSMNIPGFTQPLGVEVSAASLPGSELPAIPVAFRGRILKLPGDRRYSPWTFTVYDSPKAQINNKSAWGALHDWSNSINNHLSNITTFSSGLGEGYVGNWTLRHYDLNGSTVLKTINLFGCWPTLVGPIELQHGAMDNLVQFQCTVEYEYFTS